MAKVKLSQHSLTKRLLIFLSIPVVFIIGAATLMAIVVAKQSINTVYDQQLKNNTETLLALLHYEYAEQEYEDDDDDEEEHDANEATHELEEIVSEIEAQQNLSVNYRIRVNNAILFTSSRLQKLPICSIGFNDTEVETPQGSEIWRCYRQEQIISNVNVPISVEFFETYTLRNQAIKSLILKSFAPIFVLPLIILLVVWWGVSRGLKSLTVVSDAVKQRSVNNLQRLPRSNQPSELLPIVDSVNDLLAGVELGVMREKQFTDDAAHELRTPVTSIKMIEQLLRRDNTDPALISHLDNLKLSTEHCSTLIDQLLELARLQSTQAVQKSSINLHGFLLDQLGLLSPLITDKGLEIDLDESLLKQTVEVNEPSFAVLINNLLSNAIKFSPNKSTIYIFMQNNALCIEDNGIGIDIQERSRVFDRFYRAPTQRNTEGTGLGLALAAWVADKHKFLLSAVNPYRGSGASLKLDFAQH